MPMPDNKPGTLADLLPPNATLLERAVNQAVADQLARLPRNVARRLWNPDLCPLDLLPWLAWTYSVEVWDSNWPEAVKRARVKEAIAIARRKGTRGSIERVLKSYGGNFIIKEWWEYDPPRDPFSFDLTLNLTGADGEAATAEFIDNVMEDINRTKPVTRHYTVTQGLTASGSLGVIGATRAIVSVRLAMTAE